jgi:uncharacterized protein (DUF427 family)
VENVADYPRPPALERVPWRIRVDFGGIAIADTTRALRVLETFGAPVYYIPPADIRMDLVAPEQRSSFCEWKGIARYWSVRVGDRSALQAGWSYADPTPGFADIRDHLAFYVQKMDACWVDADRAEPQPGGFYGGWVTPEIQGPIKGAPGTTHW